VSYERFATEYDVDEHSEAMVKALRHQMSAQRPQPVAPSPIRRRVRPEARRSHVGLGGTTACRR
jgi:hypothetical protein